MSWRIGNKKKISKKKTFLLPLYVIYIVFILLFSFPYFLGEDVDNINKDYGSHLVFTEDGSYGHYSNIVMKDKNSPGVIDFEYHYESNTLYIQRIENIEQLTIDCKLMYENKCQQILGHTPGDDQYYKTYFSEKNDGLFTVMINTETPIEIMHFSNIPLPESVLVNNVEWWKSNIANIDIEGSDVTVKEMPVGLTTVKLFFDKAVVSGLNAQFTIDKQIAQTNEDITFDASGSSGNPIYYIWDFGDGTENSGTIVTHSYSEVGEFQVTLTVRDKNYIEDIHKITIQIEEPDFSTIESSSSEDSDDLVGSYPN